MVREVVRTCPPSLPCSSPFTAEVPSQVVLAGESEGPSPVGSGCSCSWLSGSKDVSEDGEEQVKDAWEDMEDVLAVRLTPFFLLPFLLGAFLGFVAVSLLILLL